MSNKTYDVLKWLVTIAFPAIITLIGTVGMAIQLENLETILTILTAINACMGTLLGISNIEYKKGGK